MVFVIGACVVGAAVYWLFRGGNSAYLDNADGTRYVPQGDDLILTKQRGIVTEPAPEIDALYPVDPKPFEWPLLPDCFIGQHGTYYAARHSEVQALDELGLIQPAENYDESDFGRPVYEPSSKADDTEYTPDEIEQVLRELRRGEVMVKHKTRKQIDAEIAALKEIKPKVRHFTAFGDDNHAAIDAQIEVLENDLDEDDIDNMDGAEFETENEVSAARDAALWRDGNFEGGSPSEEWGTLVK